MADNTPSNTNPNPTENINTSYNPATDLADLGGVRFDQDTAAISSRDTALVRGGPVPIHKGRVAAGMDAQVFAWNTYQFNTEDRNERDELKADLHGGQLHRQNRAARGELRPPPGVSRGKATSDGLRAGMRPEGEVEVPPLAKGIPEELGAELFWDKPIV